MQTKGYKHMQQNATIIKYTGCFKNHTITSL